MSAAVARKDQEIEQLKQMIRAGTMTAATLQPAIDAAVAKPARLAAQSDDRGHREIERVAKLLPKAVNAYRAMVSRLSDAKTP